jgi:hypothetical protein
MREQDQRTIFGACWKHAEDMQKLYTAHLNPYLNFHRPCGFATVSLDARGKRQRQYKLPDGCAIREVAILPQAEQHLKTGLSFAQIDKLAQKLSDTECAAKMSATNTKLLRRCKTKSPVPPRFQ